MGTSAIQLAFQLARQPNKVQELCIAETPLPNGITELLQLCASSKRLKQFSKNINVNAITTEKILVNFIEKVLITDENPLEKVLGLKSQYTNEKLKLHYQLLMKIFHPDLSISAQASNKTALISKSYKELKEKLKEPIILKNIKLSRIPPKSFYRATQSAENHHSSVKNTFIALAGMSLLSLGMMVTYLLNSTKPELLIAKQATISDARLAAKEIPIGSINTASSNVSVSKANFEGMSKAEMITSILQLMLRDIETYYEKGTVEKIKPILANTPEMSSQTDEQIQIKLEALFKITQDRKMLLYNFKWQNISGEIRGVGKFISRYQMTGENSWQTREGVAVVTAEERNKNFSIIGLTLENNIIK